MSKLVWHRLPRPLLLLVAGIVLTGCGGEENIPLKQVDPKVDPVMEKPTEPEKRKTFTQKGQTSKIGHDPSGVNKN